ncbi:GNAT family N-acetyltransferase [Halorientalis halophila]|uniref:GNAT family N-acetyltransferase n=1 Tax=Halorientalis halophila TaxID=3108499 RepID=UPI0030098C0E
MARSGVAVAETDRERADALAVRFAVFVDGQGIDPDLELDGKDDEATHFVAYDDGDPVGAARLRAVGDATGKVERVAVRDRCRGDGWGRRLMAAVHDEARARDLKRLVLHAQVRVEEFYRELGYQSVGESFEQAGIPHVEMERDLD